MLKDSVAALIIFAALLALANFLPARLGPEADPTSDFLARPAWYFLPLFELLKYFPGKFSLIPTVLLPGALFALLFLLPFFDRKSERNPLRRPIATAVFSFVLLGSVSLGVLARYQDQKNPEFSAKFAKQDEESRAFLTSPFVPQDVGDPAGPVKSKTFDKADVENGPPPAFAQNFCANCHGSHGQGGKIGPSLIGITVKANRSKEDLLKLLDNTRAYGLKDPMPESFPRLSAEDKAKIVDWLESLQSK